MTKNGFWLGAVAIASVSFLIITPFIASAAMFGGEGGSLAQQILNRVFAQLCEKQEILGNRIRLVNPKKCAPTPPPSAPMLTLMKTVVNNNEGTATAASFQAKIDGTNVSWGVAQAVSIGAHTVSEVNMPGYSASSWGGDCASNGTITLAAGEQKTCTITNDDIAQGPTTGHLIVDKVTVPAGNAASFNITASGSGVITGGGAGEVTDATNKDYEVAPGTYSVAETTKTGWVETSNTCTGIVVAAGETKTCTITNTKLPTLTLMKTVMNDNDGTAVAGDFQAKIDGSNVPWSIAQTVSIGAHTASETTMTGYTASVWSGDCASGGTITLAAGDNKTCNITNNDNPPLPEGTLLIAEVLYDIASTTSQGNDPQNEWVEIYNGTNAGINLAGYFIHDASSADLLPSVTLPAGKFAVITGSSTTATFWNIPVDAVFIVLANTTIGNGLANAGDMVWLENTASTTVDAVSWGSNTTAFSPSVTPAPDGNSIMRTSTTTDTNTAADWVPDETPTPGS